MATVAFICRAPDPHQLLHLTRQAEGLVAAQHQVDIFAPEWPALSDALSHQPGIRLRSLGNAPTSGMLATFFFWWRTLLMLTSAQVRRRYQIIQLVGTTGLFVFTTWIARRLGARVILQLTTAEPERVMAQQHVTRLSLPARVAAFLEELAVDSVDHLIAVSEPLRLRLISRGCPPEKISVIYMTPDAVHMRRHLNTPRHPSIRDRFLITFFAGPAEPNDFVTPIRAMATLKTQLPQSLLWIACSHEDQPKVAALVRQYDVDQVVVVQDDLQPEQVPLFLAQANANLIAIERDPANDLVLPWGIFEGLETGTPTLSTRTQATQFYFDPTLLLTFDNGEADVLAASLKRLAEQPLIRQEMTKRGREIVANIQWTHERQRYLALIAALLADDVLVASDIEALTGRSRMSRQRLMPARSARTGLRQVAGVTLAPDDSGTGPLDALPLRLSAPSKEWRTTRQIRLHLSAWLLRGVAAALLFGIPVVATHDNLVTKVIAAIMFAAVIVVMLALPSGEAAIIVAFYFIAQRALFLQFPPEGILGRVIVYLGTALQLIIFLGFVVRAILQQRPLLRSGFVLWPATAYFGVSLLSGFLNHVPPDVALLGIEHTLHNIVFVVLIAEDLPTPQQLRRYVAIAIFAICALATASIVQTGVAFGVLPHVLTIIPVFNPVSVPVAVIVPDAGTYAYLLMFGVFLSIGAFISLNITSNHYEIDPNAPMRLNFFLLAALCWLTLALFLTNSVENWLGLVAGVIALVLLLRNTLRYMMLTYLALILILGVITYIPAPGQALTSYWQMTVAITHGTLPHAAPFTLSLNVIADHPVLGVGPGRFGGTVASITKSPVYAAYGFTQHGHSISSINLFWLHILGETGGIGLAMYLWLIVSTSRALWLSYRRGAHQLWWGITAGVFGIVIAMSIATFFGNALEIDSLSAPFWALVGIAVALPLANRPQIALPLIRFETGANGKASDATPPERQSIDSTPSGRITTP